MDIRVTFKRPCLEAQTEVGSFAELAGLLQDESSTLLKIFGDDMEAVISGVNGKPVEGAAAEGGAVETETRKKREKKEKLAAVTAPAPLPVPTEAPAAAAATPLPPNALTIPSDGGIPPFLQRTEAPAAEVAPPLAPVAPPPPPPAAAPPPAAGPITEKVVAELIRRGVGDAEKASLVSWLAGPGISLVVAAATFDEAMACLRMQGDVKLAALLAPLGL